MQFDRRRFCHYWRAKFGICCVKLDHIDKFVVLDFFSTIKKTSGIIDTNYEAHQLVARIVDKEIDSVSIKNLHFATFPETNSIDKTRVGAKV